MPLVLAALRTGHDPVGKLPEGAFPRWLEEQIVCPRCDATYNLVADFDASVSRHFEEDSRRHRLMLRKAVLLGHGNGHRVAHFETAGVVVTSFSPSAQDAGSDPPPSDRASSPPPSRFRR